MFVNKLKYKEFSEEFNIKGDENIDGCPICHKKFILDEVAYIKTQSQIFVIAECPSQKCCETFVVKYNFNRHMEYDTEKEIIELKKDGQWPYKVEKKEIGEEIKKMSPDFAKIYNQAEQARESELTEICGVGYRKALEFLIKDYCILCNKDKEEEIKRKLLGKVIEEYITDDNIKAMAKRAVWLGNDETHYIRKWEDKDIQDLIKLIDLTMKWIDLEVTTKKYNEEMAAPIK